MARQTLRGDEGQYPDLSLVQLLRRLLAHLGRRRQRQLVAVFGLTLLGAIAEVMAIGAILPFLSLMASPEGAAGLPLIGGWIAGLGLAGRDLLLFAAAAFAGAALVAGAVRLLQAWASQKFILRLGHDIGVAIFQRVLHQPYLYHVSRNSSRFLADMERVTIVTMAVMLPLMMAASSLVMTVFILAALMAIDPLVTLLAILGFGALYLLMSRLTRHRLRANSRLIAAAQTERTRTIQEASGAIRDILLDHAQPAYIRRFTEVDLPYRDAWAANAFMGATPRYIIEGLGMVLFAGVAVILSGRPGGIASALPIMGALAIGAVRLLPMLQLIYNGWAQIAGNRQSLAEVVAALDLPMPPASAPAAPLAFADRIELQDIHFHYPSGAGPVLAGVSLTVPKGARVGIVGKTGSGKSTLMDLLLGLLEPDQGRILIDGIALGPKTRAAWQARVAHVPQAIYLADCSLAENIAFAVPRDQIDMARVRRAAEQAVLADFVATLPDGYHSFVGERGVRLSGGQRQRIAIARALYRNADVLVFDEATSALDSATEAEVMAAVDGLSRDLTIFLIAHRTSTLEGCDMMVELEGAAKVAPPYS